MGQTRILRLGGNYYREYQVEAGDSVPRICLRFGQPNWRTIYNNLVNDAFRRRFPNPSSIRPDSSVPFFIPLLGAAGGGRRIRGIPLRDYFIAHITLGGDALPNTPLRLIIPGQDHAGVEQNTTADGDIIVPTPLPGDWNIASPNYEFLTTATQNQAFGVEPISALPQTGGLLHPNSHFTLTRNTIVDVIARRVFFIICPLCAVTFRTVAPAPGAAASVCPNDGFNLTNIETQITARPMTYRNPATGQNPSANPTSLLCRGMGTAINTVHGSVEVFWDESRFVAPNEGDYTLWGRSSSGAAMTQRIIGRRTWGARSPNVTSPRRYEFHQADLNVSAPYASAGVQSNETLQLSSVFRWMTIHHTTDPARNSFRTAIDLQAKHQDHGIEGAGPAADIGYHFIVDANGTVYEGRPLGIEGAHVGQFNAGNVGIVMAGDFQRRTTNPFPDTPTVAALGALHNLISVLSRRFGIQDVAGHNSRNMQAHTHSTDCPGANMIPHIRLPAP